MKSSAKQKGLSLTNIRKRYGNPDFFISMVPQVLEQARATQPICCFTETYDNPLMWSYYSASHRSFAYAFRNRLEPNEESNFLLGRIKYLGERPVVRPSEVLRMMINNSWEISSQMSQLLKVSEEEDKRLTDALVLSKSNHWQHEQEWRYLQPTGTSPGYFGVDPYQFEGIIFGVNAEPKLIEFVRRSIGKRAGYWQLSLCETTYGLRKKRLGK